MKVLSRGCFYILLLFILISCSDKPADNDSEIRQRYYNLENQGWRSRIYSEKIDDLTFTATNVPTIYYILKENGNQNLINTDSIYNANKTERIIEFEFLQDQGKDLLKGNYTRMNYDENLQYISFNLQKDFYIVTSKRDTILCSGLTFERTYNVAPYNKILLFFTGIEPDEKIQLVYNDKLFNKGTFKFMFNDKITNILL